MAESAVRITEAFERARGEGRAALMPYLMGGFPNRGASDEIAEAYISSGADLVELGVPFSDPLADGPVIHAAGTRALASGATLASVLEQCSRIAGRVPVVPMIYANMVLVQGAEDLARRLDAAGAAGLIVPDLPHGQDAEVRSAMAAAGLPLVPLVAPTTTQQRIQAICEAAEGFVYVVSTTGVTGERDHVPAELAGLVEDVRAAAGVPAAVGFGIGTPEHAAAVGRIADGVIIGTRLVRAADEGGAAAVGDFLQECRSALAATSDAPDRVR